MLTAIRPSDGDVKSCGPLVLIESNRLCTSPGFTFGLPFIIIPHTTHLGRAHTNLAKLLLAKALLLKANLLSAKALLLLSNLLLDRASLLLPKAKAF